MNERPAVDDREPDILEAFTGLGAPAGLPPDLLARVDRRLRHRRTARRGAALVAVLAVVGGAGIGVLGGSDGDSIAADEGGGATSTLTYTDRDGSTYAFDADDISVVCTPDGQLYLTRREFADALRTGRELADKAPEAPVLYVELVVDHLTPDQVFTLPFDDNAGTSDQPTRTMTFFFTDGTGDDANELSSAEPGSSGTVTVHEATCGPTPSLWVEIDGTLGSEVDQPALAITGEYRSG